MEDNDYLAPPTSYHNEVAEALQAHNKATRLLLADCTNLSQHQVDVLLHSATSSYLKENWSDSVYSKMLQVATDF